MTSTTFCIDFENQTVTESQARTGEDRMREAAAKTGVVRDLLRATVQAIRNDPSILAIVDDPGSEKAGRALAKLGVFDDLMNDDITIEDFR